MQRWLCSLPSYSPMLGCCCWLESPHGLTQVYMQCSPKRGYCDAPPSPLSLISFDVVINILVTLLALPSSILHPSPSLLSSLPFPVSVILSLLFLLPLVYIGCYFHFHLFLFTVHVKVPYSLHFHHPHTHSHTHTLTHTHSHTHTPTPPPVMVVSSVLLGVAVSLPLFLLWFFTGWYYIFLIFYGAVMGFLITATLMYTPFGGYFLVMSSSSPLPSSPPRLPVSLPLPLPPSCLSLPPLPPFLSLPSLPFPLVSPSSFSSFPSPLLPSCKL